MKKFLTALACALAVSPVFAEVTFEEVRVRAVPTTQKVTAAFMQIHNSGPEDLTIVSASSPASKVVELHTHMRDGEKMLMRQIPEIALPAGATTSLQPGGLHLMLIGLEQPVMAGENVEITLQLSNGETQTLSAPVQPIMPGQHNRGHQGGHQNGMKAN